MKNKKGIIILIVLILIAVYLYFNKSTGTISSELKDFAIRDTSNVERIFISTQNGDKADVVREDDKWMVNGKYFARRDAVDLILETIYRIDVISPVSQSEFENVVRRLSSSAVKVEFYKDKDGEPEKVYYVGEATANHHGTYMLLEMDGKKSSLPFITYVPGFYGYLSTRFFTDENLWRDRTIFKEKPENIKSLHFNYATDPSKSFSIENTEEGFIAKNNEGKVISTEDASLASYLNRYNGVYFEYVEVDMAKEIKDSVLASTPQHIIELENKQGDKQRLTTYLKPLTEAVYDINTGERLTHNLDRCVAMINDVDFVTVQYVTLDELLITAQDISEADDVDK